MSNSTLPKLLKIHSYALVNPYTPDLLEQTENMEQWVKLLNYDTDLTIVQEFADISVEKQNRHWTKLQLLINSIPTCDGVIVYNLSTFQNVKRLTQLLLAIRLHKKSLYIAQTHQIFTPNPNQSLYFDTLAGLILEIEEKKSHRKSTGLKNSPNKIGRPKLKNGGI